MAKRRNRRSAAKEPRARGREGPRVPDDGGDEREIDQKRIAERAYERYLARGREDGHDLNDWFEAEREVCEQRDR